MAAVLQSSAATGLMASGFAASTALILIGVLMLRRVANPQVHDLGRAGSGFMLWHCTSFSI
ncbi:hypothetical protein AB4Z52_22000 [Rhizobium sp. 2YAF20]|uniref:hypothetical protein n=1 Tax=Rhizobium sp. 2YAF20 TaxID=3233027 RepID=UPI003F9C5E9B